MESRKLDVRSVRRKISRDEDLRPGDAVLFVKGDACRILTKPEKAPWPYYCATRKIRLVSTEERFLDAQELVSATDAVIIHGSPRLVDELAVGRRVQEDQSRDSPFTLIRRLSDTTLVAEDGVEYRLDTSDLHITFPDTFWEETTDEIFIGAILLPN